MKLHEMARYLSKMQILRGPGYSGSWVDAIIDGYYVTAKVFSNPSMFGINSGRISKLTVVADTEWNYDKIVVNYDRGWDIGRDFPGLDSIVSQLENYAKDLPPPPPA